MTAYGFSIPKRKVEIISLLTRSRQEAAILVALNEADRQSHKHSCPYRQSVAKERAGSIQTKSSTLYYRLHVRKRNCVKQIV
ncbi:Hypothetical predicted protein [Xyrichtys novacula]|nr:Hypothetical predicted protein [Xyrichtys novacula]